MFHFRNFHWESKRTWSMNFDQLFDTYRGEFIEMHVYRIKTFSVRSLNIMKQNTDDN